MHIIIGILVLIIVIQILVLWKYQRQVKDICRQLSFLNRHDSNMLITREFDLGGIGKLADILNEFLILRRKERKEYLEKEKMISDTYTNLSHDIRTPLTSLDGYFQLLENSSDQEEQKRYLGIIQERIGSLKDMLEELFTFTKLKNESYHLELCPCCVNRILKDTVFSYYEDWTRRGIEPELDITDKLLYMEGNSQGLRRAMQNIIKNAMDHGIKNIKVSLQGDQGEIVLRICNKVREPEKIDAGRAFERFYKADEARSRNSTGLGLAIAKELVVRMRGTVNASVEQDEFCIEMRFPQSDMKKADV